MAEQFTFVHAADLHLDAPFAGVDASDPRVRDGLVASTFSAFERIVDVCLEREAAFLVIAGDLYNTAERSVRAQGRFRDAAERLGEAGVHIYIACGNHDPAGGWSAGLTMPANVTHFSADEVGREVFARDGEALAVLYGRSYGRAAETRNLALEFAKAAGDPFAIGVLHANVGGQPGFEPYAPCSLDDLHAARMDYWALGHIHKRMKLAEEPPVVYPGSPQGLNPTETGGHGCAVVTVAEGRASVEFVETAEVVWERTDLDLTDAATVDDVLDALERACAAARERSGGRPVIVRADLDGRSEAHPLLAGERVLADVVEQVRGTQMASEPWVWLDRARDLTRPAIDLDAVREGGGFAAEVVRVADAHAVPDEAAALLGDVLAPLHRVLDGVDLDLDAVDVVERARDLCLDKLLAEEGR